MLLVLAQSPRIPVPRNVFGGKRERVLPTSPMSFFDFLTVLKVVGTINRKFGSSPNYYSIYSGEKKTLFSRRNTNIGSNSIATFSKRPPEREKIYPKFRFIGIGQELRLFVWSLFPQHILYFLYYQKKTQEEKIVMRSIRNVFLSHGLRKKSSGHDLVDSIACMSCKPWNKGALEFGRHKKSSAKIVYN